MVQWAPASAAPEPATKGKSQGKKGKKGKKGAFDDLEELSEQLEADPVSTSAAALAETPDEIKELEIAESSVQPAAAEDAGGLASTCSRFL